MSARPLPLVSEQNRHFWTGGASNRLQFLRCDDCGWFLHPPGPRCTACLSQRLSIEAVSGLGTIATFTVNHQPWRPDLQAPYVIAIVELNEQVALRLTTNIVNCPIEAVHIGQRVRVLFAAHEDTWIPLFEPAEQSVADPHAAGSGHGPGLPHHRPARDLT